MRKIGTIFVVGLLLVGFAMAGGIVHNTNQSADFIRLLNRNASTDIDAVYFNPAGLTALNDGLHFYLSNQTIFQNRTVTNDLATLNSDTFEGETSAPIFPNFYAVYKKDNLAVGAGFTPIGGGGSAVFDNGLPSFEVPVSAIPTSLVTAGIPTDKYSLDVAFEGSSVYLAGQAVVAYKINDMFSVAGGARYFQASNTYEGHLKDIMINPTVPGLADGSMVKAETFFNTMASALADGAQQALGGVAGAQAGAAALQPLIDAGAGDLTFDTLIGLGLVDQATVDATAGGFAALGIPFDSSIMTPAQAQAAALAAAQTYADLAADLTGQSAAMAANAEDVKDKEVDAKQTGSGFAPILGLYISPMEGLDIGIRYEGKAELTLENETKVDDTGLYQDGVETSADMPAMLSVGVGYTVMPSLRFVADFNYYFNEDVDWEGREEFVENGVEYGLGLDFAVNDALRLSAGYLSGSSGAKDQYHSDFSQSFTTHTVGVGGRYYINEGLYVSFGVSDTFYEDIEKDNVSYGGNETYDKSTLNFAIGVGFSK